ncbi:hypothetical protein [Pilimelia columellifera]|uniref:Uncharacterized protein n=1 Tax=Pilimelia columellifera subsp. columellifera TaxID=706583 RepID=A0ABN3N754_9ACTN
MPQAQPRTGRPAVTLPGWMATPEPARLTLSGRLATLVFRVPGAAALRERWWRFAGRTRLADRYPRSVAVLGAFLAFAGTCLLVGLAFLMLALA